MDDTTKQLIKSAAAGAIRHLATAAGGYLAATGLANADQVSMVTGAIVFLGGLGWSYAEKHIRILGGNGSGAAKAGIVALLSIGGLTYGCTNGAPDLQTVEADVQAACLAYVPVSNALATAPAGSSAQITKGYVDGMCSLAYPGTVTPQGKLAIDPTTAAWVQAGTAALKAAAILLPSPPPFPAPAPAAPSKPGATIFLLRPPVALPLEAHRI